MTPFGFEYDELASEIDDAVDTLHGWLVDENEDTAYALNEAENATAGLRAGSWTLSDGQFAYDAIDDVIAGQMLASLHEGLPELGGA